METDGGDGLLERAVADVRARTDRQARVAVVLGSGLGGFADRFDEPVAVPYADIVGLPSSSVAGHAGQLVFGRCAGVDVVAMQGRVHLYEGHSPQQVVFGVRLMHALGATDLVVTNAAGGVDAALPPGSLLCITDHLNLTGVNCLVGPNDAALGPRFPDMGDAYTARLRTLALELAQEQGTTLHEGVYAGVLGPSYETPAEIRMLQTLGASAVGMSTVQEVIAARHLGMRVLGISCITNAAAGLTNEVLKHEDVQRAAQAASAALQRLVAAIVGKLPDTP